MILNEAECDVYEVDFQVSFMDFKNAHNIDTEKATKAILKMTTDNYQTKASPDEIMKFFNIHDKYSEEVMNKDYDLSFNIKEVRDDLGVMVIECKCLINHKDD